MRAFCSASIGKEQANRWNFSITISIQYFILIHLNTSTFQLWDKGLRIDTRRTQHAVGQSQCCLSFATHDCHLTYVFGVFCRRQKTNFVILTNSTMVPFGKPISETIPQFHKYPVVISYGVKRWCIAEFITDDACCYLDEVAYIVLDPEALKPAITAVNIEK